MKICIIHGSPRKGNTLRATEIFKSKMTNLGDIEFKEFNLAKDMPYFCLGCFNCIEKGEGFCPHFNYINPIVEAIRASDGLILTTPVYVLAESGQMKAFLDHLAYMFIPHRPMEEMFSKVAMAISTTAGAGTNKAISTVKRSLNYWGIRRVQKCGLRLLAKDWDDMTDKKQRQFESRLENEAKKFYYTVLKRNQLPTRFFTRSIFLFVKNMIKGYSDDMLDKKYWDNKGWLSNKNPFVKY